MMYKLRSGLNIKHSSGAVGLQHHMKRHGGENRKHQYILSEKSAEINRKNPHKSAVRMLTGISKFTSEFNLRA